MPDITDLFSSVSRTKVTPTKGYQANFTTTSTTFVDVTGLSVSVPNGSFFAIRGVLGANSPTMTTTLQVLLGATVMFTDTEASGGGGGASKTTDSLVLYNNTGSTQTAKVQIHSDNVSNTASAQTMSIIQGTYINSISLWAGITSIDFVSATGNGTTAAYYEGVSIGDTTTTAVTWNGNKFVSGGVSFTGATYVAWDYTGKTVII